MEDTFQDEELEKEGIQTRRFHIFYILMTL